MKVKELRNILEIVDGECEVLVVNKFLDAYQIERGDVDPYYKKQTTDNEVPFCLRIED
ncbi:hypothetical protein EJM73_19130 [Clostridium botulinum]|uniref:hypothetical protein n=1 Tax=Clostridium botulinum TaxID=1491 RepID=UPI00137613DB|nr:hypothetical protein [Clostridium botulinum]EJP6471393.1 hypothetical protein [Clostridium botulinum]NCI22023.1 hypothetical protein [Clostridium botulinum]NCI37727.1 hypothetical protein [Clostridium botulinum]NCI74348.1 hypothetical protein [Clostridium botulinum]NDI40598.1 hypothetical protein [Clostridium botulinum]